MINSNDKLNTLLSEVLSDILDKLDESLKSSYTLLELINACQTEQANVLVSGLIEKVKYVKEAQKDILHHLKNSFSSSILSNIEDNLLSISQELNDVHGNEPSTQAKFLCEFQLIPLCRIAKEAFYFWGRVEKDLELTKHYYEHEFAFNRQNHYVASGANLPYQASVVVVAYNHLEDLTKKCVESILQNTDFAKLNCELILVDHGSTDGTLEYFKTIPNAKVIHFKHNMWGAMFQMMPMICQSPYYVHVANDIVVTRDWLDILLTCIKSDPKIVQVVPASCGIGNNQGVVVPFSTCDEVVAYANEHNSPDPQLWFDRVKLFPAMCVCSIPILNNLGFWDPGIYTFDICDDDFSLRARRAGFRQVQCNGVVAQSTI